MRKIDAIVEIIKKWESSKIIAAWNAYCEDNNDPDSMVEYMDSFDELFSGMTPTEIAERVSHGTFCSGDDYWCFNGYGNIKTFSYWDDNDSPVDVYAIAEWLIDGGDADYDVDTDELADAFVDEYYPDLTCADKADVLLLVDEVIENESFDLLTEDWDDLNEIISSALGNRKMVTEMVDALGANDCISLDEIDFYGENGMGKALGISKDEDGNTQIGYDINGFLFVDKVEVSELPYDFINDVAEAYKKATTNE